MYTAQPFVLPLLRVAELAVPSQAAQIKSAMYHLMQQQSKNTNNTTGDSSTEFDHVMQTFLNSFPGLQSMVQQILSGNDENGGGLTGVLNQVQSLMQPLLAQVSTDPGAPDLRPISWT